jgi:outer membrane usher protein
MSLAASGNAAAQGGGELLLEVWINGATRHVVVHATNRDGVMRVQSADLLAAGINVTPDEVNTDGSVAIAKLAGMKAEVEDAEQRLIITTEQSRLATQVLDLRPAVIGGAAQSTTGFIGSYNIVGTVGDLSRWGQTAGVEAALGGTLFTPQGTLTATGLGQLQDGNSNFLRLDTTAEIDEPNAVRRWQFGDAISGGLVWSRSVRFAGVQVATDFSLQPQLATLPLPAFFGQTAVPGTVDVYVNSARVFEGGVEPGPFQIRDLPVVTGGGTATVVVHDELGREITQTLSFYATNELLEKGLSAYDLDFGFLRQFYGEKSFDYRDPLATGTYRFGVTDWLTLEAHSEAAADVQLAGGGGALALGSYGVAEADAAFSNGKYGQGELYSTSFQSLTRPFSIFGAASATSGKYADLGSLGVGGLPPPQLRLQLGASYSMGRAGAFAVSWIDTKDPGEAATQIANASYTLSFGNGLYFGATGLYDMGNKKWAAEAFFSVRFGDDEMASASVQSGTHTNEEQVTLQKPTNPDGGFGYRLTASAGDTNIEEGEATWIGQHGSLDADISSIDGDVAARLSASGALVVMDGSVFATRNPNGSVALVETGEQNVRIYRENREVATADGNGEALVTDLVPYAPNQIAIEPNDYPFSTIVENSQQIVIPRRLSGVVVDLAPAPGRGALMTLRLSDGTAPPLGAEVMLAEGTAPLVVGHHGEVFIPDLHGPATGTVTYPKGQCQFSVVPPVEAPKNSIAKIGPIVCVTGAAHEN